VPAPGGERGLIVSTPIHLFIDIFILFGQYQKSHESIVTLVEHRPEVSGPPCGCGLLNQNRVAQVLFASFSYSSSLLRLKQDECSHL